MRRLVGAVRIEPTSKAWEHCDLNSPCVTRGLLGSETGSFLSPFTLRNLYLRATPSLPASRSSDDQRGYQEARAGGQLQERRRQVGSLSGAGQRPRLPL